MNLTLRLQAKSQLERLLGRCWVKLSTCRSALRTSEWPHVPGPLCMFSAQRQDAKQTSTHGPTNGDICFQKALVVISLTYLSFFNFNSRLTRWSPPWPATSGLWHRQSSVLGMKMFLSPFQRIEPSRSSVNKLSSLFAASYWFKKSIKPQLPLPQVWNMKSEAVCYHSFVLSGTPLHSKYSLLLEREIFKSVDDDIQFILSLSTAQPVVFEGQQTLHHGLHWWTGEALYLLKTLKWTRWGPHLLFSTQVWCFSLSNHSKCHLVSKMDLQKMEKRYEVQQEIPSYQDGKIYLLFFWQRVTKKCCFMLSLYFAVVIYSFQRNRNKQLKIRWRCQSPSWKWPRAAPSLTPWPIAERKWTTFEPQRMTRRTQELHVCDGRVAFLQ